MKDWVVPQPPSQDQEQGKNVCSPTLVWTSKWRGEIVIYQDNLFHRCYLIPSPQYPAPDQLQHRHTNTHTDTNHTYYLNVFVKTNFQPNYQNSCLNLLWVYRGSLGHNEKRKQGIKLTAKLWDLQKGKFFKEKRILMRSCMKIATHTPLPCCGGSGYISNSIMFSGRNVIICITIKEE